MNLIYLSQFEIIFLYKCDKHLISEITVKYSKNWNSLNTIPTNLMLSFWQN